MSGRFPRLVFFVALLLRSIPVLFSYNLGIGLDDMFQYDMLARSILAGNGYRWYSEPDLQLAQQYISFDVNDIAYDPRGILTSHRAPLYPLMLSFVYAILGLERRFFFARLIQALMGAFLAPVTYFIFQKIFGDETRGAKLAAWFVACYPMLLLFPLALATENLFFLLVVCLVWAILWSGEDRGSKAWVRYVIAGGILGLAILTRSVILMVLPFVFLWYWLGVKSRKGAILFAVTAIGITIPWAVRNSLLHDRLVYVETSMGYNMYLGYHPESTGTFQYGISLDLLPILDDDVRNQTGMEKSLEFIRNDPGRVPYLVLRKAGYFWGIERRALEYFYSNNFFGYIPTPLLIVLAIVIYLPLVVLLTLAVLGCIQNPLPVGLWVIFAIGLGYFIPHVIILSEERFHMALIPLIAILAAYTLANWKKVIDYWKPLTLQGKRVLLLLVLGGFWVNWICELVIAFPRLVILFGPNGNQAFFPY